MRSGALWLLITALMSSLVHVLASPPLLSPLNWPPGVLDELFVSGFMGQHPLQAIQVPPAATRGGAVSGTTNMLAAFSGEFALLQGGNAMDACLVTAITQTVLAANSYVNLAGIADIVYFDAATNQSTSFYGGWSRPSPAAQAALRSGSLGGRVLIGGFLSAAETASRTYGVLPFSNLFDAAQFFAAHGAPSSALRYVNHTSLLLTAEGRALWAAIANQTNFTQPELASLLHDIQVNGTAATMYNGSFAALMRSVVNENGGNLSARDTESYRSDVQNASVFHGRGHNSTDFWVSTGSLSFSLGAVEVMEQAGLLEASGLAAIASYAWANDSPRTRAPSAFGGNATAVAWLIEFELWSMAMSDNFFAGLAGIAHAKQSFPEAFSHCDTLSGTLLSPNPMRQFSECRTQSATTTAVWRLMSTNVTAFNERLDGFLQRSPKRNRRTPRSTPHSDGVVAIDLAGNVCALSHSINTATMWGTGLFVRGVPLTDAGAGPLNQAYIFEDEELQYPHAHLPTPTREVVGVSTNRTFAIATIGDSLSQVTLQLMTSLLSNAQPINYTTNQGLFLNEITRPLAVSFNLCTPCDGVNDTAFCAQQNQMTNCVTNGFLQQLPSWVSPYVSVMQGAQRWEHSGPMAVAERRTTPLQQAPLEFSASSCPGGNGFGFVGCG